MSVSLLKALKPSVVHLDFEAYYFHISLMTSGKAFAVTSADI